MSLNVNSNLNLNEVFNLLVNLNLKEIKANKKRCPCNMLRVTRDLSLSLLITNLNLKEIDFS